MKYLKKGLLFVGLFLFFCSPGIMGQLSEMVGISMSDCNNNHLLMNKKPICNWQFGVFYRQPVLTKPFNLDIQGGLLFNSKGYQQSLDKVYRIQFNYLSFPVVFVHTFYHRIGLQAGMEFSRLIDSNVKKWESTYRMFDTGLVIGITVFDHSRFSLYARGVYGLLPTLDYIKFDKLGNFTEEIHGLQNRSVSVGLKIKLYDFTKDN